LSKSSKNLCKSNSIGFAFSEINLDNVFVFPQPLSITKNQFCTFGNLTNNSVIEIYSNSGELINSLKEAEGNGGFKWDGKNLSGEIVKSGIYLYRVVNYGTDNLELKNSGWKKIVIVP
jgi:flagellar hook assembly protein FlgD